jgi:dephospho-CoA kinase
VDDNSERSQRDKTPVAGVSGAVAAGKSTVAEMLAEIVGGRVISADSIAHELLVGNKEVKQGIIERWGDACLDEHGEIARERLAEIVFNSAGELAELNRIVHPSILKRIREEIDAARKEKSAWLVLDAALLFETGLDKVCDVRIFVETSPDVRAERARQSRGWDTQELTRRQRAQISLKTKRESSDYTINNSGKKHETKRQIEETIKKIQELGRRTNGELESHENRGRTDHRRRRT